jgi:ribonucleoside-diphosphate reductase alpha chain
MTRFAARQDIKVPEEWSLEAAEAFSEALYAHVPASVAPVEENTMPSWLWRHRAAPNAAITKENGALSVFDRIAGAATYRGWKLGLWKKRGRSFDLLR